MKDTEKTAAGRGTLKGDLERILRSPGEIAGRIKGFADRLSSFLDGASVSVYLYDRELGELLLKASSLSYRGGGPPLRHSAAGTLPFMAIEERRGLSLAEREGVAAGRLRAEHHVFPLEAQEDMTGAVDVERVAERPLEGGRLVLVRDAVRLLAATIDEARAKEINSQRLGRAAALNEAGVTLVSTGELEDLLQRFTDIAALVTGAESALLRLCDEQTGAPALRDCRGLDEGQAREEVIRLDLEASGEVLARGEPLLVRDTGLRKKYRPFRGVAASFICHPLRGRAGLLGTLTVVNKRAGNTFSPPCFTGEDLEVLGHLVRYAERAIDEARERERRRELEERDEETGLPNTRGFRGRLHAELSRARRFDSRVVLLGCQVDPGAGADEGSRPLGELLKTVGRSLRSTLRDYDVVARIDDLRFGIILPQAEEGTRGAVPRLMAALVRDIDELGGSASFPSAAIGFTQALYPADGDDAEQLLGALRKGRIVTAAEGEEQGPAGDDRIADILRGAHLFFGLGDDQLRTIAGLALSKRFDAGDEVYREGDAGDCIYLLEEGEIDLYRTREDGRKARLGSLKPGALFGEMILVLREPRAATAVAAQDSRIVCLRHLDLTRLFHEDRDLMLLVTMNLTRILARRLRRADISRPG